MSEAYTPAGGVGTAVRRATVAEAATGTHGDEFMRTNPTVIADKARYLKDTGLFNFPAVQVVDADPNVLDDYEEGTFTPALNFGGATTGIAYSTQSGRYTKIGRKVFVLIFLVLTNKGSAVGNATIEGLPFTQGATSVVGVLAVDSGAAIVTPKVHGLSSSTSARLFSQTATGLAFFTEANFTNTSNVYITLEYVV